MQGYVPWRRRAAAAHRNLRHDLAIKKYNKWQIFFSNVIDVAKDFEWGALAILGIQERPNLAHKLVTKKAKKDKIDPQNALRRTQSQR